MKKYQIIYADPPWRYEFSPTVAKAIERHYQTMSIDEICSMPVSDMVGEDCALFLWGVYIPINKIHKLIERSCAGTEEDI